MQSTPVAEEWRPVVGYEGFYEVSDMGRVRSVDRRVPKGNHYITRRGQEMRPTTITGGYRQLGLSKHGGRKSFLVHHIVLNSFVSPRPEGMEACHNDGDPNNNRLYNLRWDTPSNNTYDRVRHGTHFCSRKTHCPRGHKYDFFYTRKDGGTSRGCTACRRENNRKRYARVDTAA